MQNNNLSVLFCSVGQCHRTHNGSVRSRWSFLEVQSPHEISCSNTGTNLNNTDNNTVTSFFSFNLCSNQLLNGSKSLPLLLACHPLVITHMELCQWHKALMELLPQLLQCLLRLPLSINIFYNHFHSHFRAPHRHLRRRFAECEIKTKLSLNRESPKKKMREVLWMEIQENYSSDQQSALPRYVFVFWRETVNKKPPNPPYIPRQIRWTNHIIRFT